MADSQWEHSFFQATIFRAKVVWQDDPIADSRLLLFEPLPWMVPYCTKHALSRAS